MSALDLARASPHDFTLQYPPRREYFQERFRAPATKLVTEDLEGVLLYLHVPFCASHCSYCNFAVDVRDDRLRQARYVDGMLRRLEVIERALPSFCRIRGIDVGGGTPTLLQPRQLDRLLEGLAPFLARSAVDRPLSIETTPTIAAHEPEKLAILRSRGVDRVSIGLQSADSETLRALRRDPSTELHARAMANLRARGFHRINLDLIFALPDQSEARWASDLEHAIALRPDSITTYDCLYRGKGRALTRRTLRLPGPSRYGALYDLGYSMLRDAGYHAPYGSVNHSIRLGETGTSPYFEGRLLDGLPYLGVGSYATSHRDDRWTFEERGVDRWIERALHHHPVADSYLLPREETITKYALLSLSFGRLDRARFRRRFGEELEERLSDGLRLACDEGWLVRDDDGYGVGPGRFDALPNVRALLYPPAAIAWLERLRHQANCPMHVPGANALHASCVCAP